MLPLSACDGATGSSRSALEDHTGQTCLPGSVAACQCESLPGATLTQSCGADGKFAPCPCPIGVAGGGAGVVSGAGTAGFETAAGSGGVVVPPGGSGAPPAGGSGGTDVPPAAGTGGVSGSDGIAGSMAAGSGGSGGAPSTTGGEPKIPSITEQCPTLKTGNVTVLGQQVQLWVGAKQADKKGAVMFYWHGTGSSSGEATGGLGSALTEIQAEGGIVASFTTSTTQGANTANNVWYTGDFAMADIILACAVQQLNIDTRRIYSAGCSAGGLQTGAMVYGRSSYLAAAMPNSGGIITFFKPQMDDPSHVPSVITTHGGSGDVVGVNFTTTSADLYNDIVSKGGFAVNCNHGGSHCGSPSDVKKAQWEFLKAHPFGVDPEPYAGGLPAGFPSSCTIIM